MTYSPGMVRHQVVIHPQAAHGVVDGRVDAHRHLVRVLAGDALVHLEQVSVALLDDMLAEPLDGVAEIEVNRQSAFAHAPALVAHHFGVAGSYVARHQVAETRVAPLQVVIALRLRDLVGRPLVALLERHPHAAVIAQRLAHEGELRLIVARDRNAGGMNLGEAGVGEQRAALMGAPDSGGVGTLGVGGEVVDVAVTARAQHHGVAEVRLDLAR